MPGFRKISMYPKLWEASDIPYSELIDRLILLAIQRFEKEQKLQTSYEGGRKLKGIIYKTFLYDSRCTCD